MKKPNKKSQKQLLTSAMGAGARMVYLEKNPHGFTSVHKVHVSKKSYKREKKVNFD